MAKIEHWSIFRKLRQKLDGQLLAFGVNLLFCYKAVGSTVVHIGGM